MHDVSLCIFFFLLFSIEATVRTTQRLDSVFAPFVSFPYSAARWQALRGHKDSTGQLHQPPGEDVRRGDAGLARSVGQDQPSRVSRLWGFSAIADHRYRGWVWLCRERTTIPTLTSGRSTVTWHSQVDQHLKMTCTIHVYSLMSVNVHSQFHHDGVYT